MKDGCGCGGSGTVRATRIRGRAAGAWGTAKAGETVDVPKSVVRAHPNLWDWPGKNKPEPAGEPESPSTGVQDLEGFTVPELRTMAQEAGIELPGKARKADIIEALQAG